MLTLETILKDSLWVAKVGGFRFVDTYDEVSRYTDDPERRDIDLCGMQPDHLMDFYEGYFNQTDYYVIQDYYNEVYSKEVVA